MEEAPVVLPPFTPCRSRFQDISSFLAMVVSTNVKGEKGLFGIHLALVNDNMRKETLASL